MRVRQPETSDRKERGPLPLGDGDEVGHGLGDRNGVHGDVREVHPRHGALGRPAQVGLGQVGWRDAGQQVGGVHDEVVIEPDLAGDAP